MTSLRARWRVLREGWALDREREGRREVDVSETEQQGPTTPEPAEPDVPPVPAPEPPPEEGETDDDKS